jgi:hypothetical protein
METPADDSRVKCPVCDRRLKLKTLRYSHVCPFERHPSMRQMHKEREAVAAFHRRIGGRHAEKPVEEEEEEHQPPPPPQSPPPRPPKYRDWTTEILG